MILWRGNRDRYRVLASPRGRVVRHDIARTPSNICPRCVPRRRNGQRGFSPRRARGKCRRTISGSLRCSHDFLFACEPESLGQLAILRRFLAKSSPTTEKNHRDPSCTRRTRTMLLALHGAALKGISMQKVDAARILGSSSRADEQVLSRRSIVRFTPRHP